MDEYFGSLESLHLSAKAMELINHYMSGYNAIGSRYGILAYMLGFSDFRELLLDLVHPGKEAPTDGLL